MKPGRCRAAAAVAVAVAVTVALIIWLALQPRQFYPAAVAAHARHLHRDGIADRNAAAEEH